MSSLKTKTLFLPGIRLLGKTSEIGFLKLFCDIHSVVILKARASGLNIPYLTLRHNICPFI